MASFLNMLLSFSNEDDQEKIIFIYEHYHNEMIKITKGRLKGSGVPNYAWDAEDIVQETFLRVVKYAYKINMEMEEHKIRSYVLTILGNVIHDYFSSKTYDENLDDYEPTLKSDDDFIETMNIRERYDEVMKAIDSLDEIYRITFVLKYQKEMEVEKIAEFMEVPVKTVYTRLFRGKKLLLERLGYKNGEISKEKKS